MAFSTKGKQIKTKGKNTQIHSKLKCPFQKCFLFYFLLSHANYSAQSVTSTRVLSSSPWKPDTSLILNTVSSPLLFLIKTTTFENGTDTLNSLCFLILRSLHYFCTCIHL